MLHHENFHCVIIAVRNRPPDPCVLGLNNSIAFCSIAVRNTVKCLKSFVICVLGENNEKDDLID